MVTTTRHIRPCPSMGCIRKPDQVLGAFLSCAYAGSSLPVLVAVGGPGGTGKSTFARNLAQTIGKDRAVVLPLDDYKTPRAVRSRKNIFGPHPDANEMQMIRDHLETLRQGLPIDKPCYCAVQGQINRFEPFTPARFVIVEGEVSTYRAFRDVIDFAIFIDAHWKTQLNTRLTRDIEQRGYTLEKAIATFLHSNLREFPTYGGLSKNECDIHIHCDDDYTLVIDAVAEIHLSSILKILSSQHKQTPGQATDNAMISS